MIYTAFDSPTDFDPSFIPPPVEGMPTPVWELATMYPPQGAWTEEEYLQLTDETNRRIEFTDGNLEFLPVPTLTHQLILVWLFELLRDHVKAADAGLALPSGTRVRTPDGEFREPDIVFVLKASPKRGERFFSGADLVVEIVSGSTKDRQRDLVSKVAIYAAAGIPEYWIVDPQESKITVLALPEGTSEYAEHGVFHSGETATSKLLDGFVIDVKACFDAAKG